MQTEGTMISYPLAQISMRSTSNTRPPVSGIRRLGFLEGRNGAVSAGTDRSYKIVIVSTHVIADIEPIAKEILMRKEGKLLKRLSLQEDRFDGESLEDMYIRLFQ